MGLFKDNYLEINENFDLKGAIKIIQFAIKEYKVKWKNYGKTPQEQLENWAEEMLEFDLHELAGMYNISSNDAKHFFNYISNNASDIVKKITLK